MPIEIKAIMDRAEAMQGHRRAHWDGHFQSIRDVIHPLAPSFLGQESDGARRRMEIFDNSTEMASKILASALHGMMTNPAQKWFQLRTTSDDLNQRDDVKRWLEAVTKRLLNLFAAPEVQFTTQIARTYRVLVDFGTAPLYIYERPGRLPLFQAVPLSQSYIAENEEGLVDTLFRIWDWPARQAYQRYGDAIGEKAAGLAKDPAKAGQTVKFLEATFPRRDAALGRMDARGLSVAHVVINMDDGLLVHESGFHEMPFIVPRWAVSPGENYGRSPGMEALPDVRTLQRHMKTVIKSGERATQPSYVMADDGVYQLRLGADRINYVNPELFNMRHHPIAPLNTGSRPDIGEEFAEQIRARIRDAYFNALLMLNRQKEMTATEALLVDEERLRVLGPVLGRLQTEALGPIITRCYGILDRAEALPPAPGVMNGAALRVDYVSPLAKAQRLNEVTAMSRWFDMMALPAQVDPTVFDIADFDGGLREAAELMGVPLASVRSREGTAQLREQRAEAQERERALQEGMGAAAAAQSLAQASATVNDNNTRAA